MKKKLIGILCGALALSVAVPAMADHKIGGYFRTQAYVQQQMGKNVENDLFVAQRIRMKWTNTLNDYVAVVWYGEVNNYFGQKTDGANGDKVGRYSGASFGTDGVNVQTKHAYADLKIPSEMGAVVRVGLQGVGDSIQNLVINEDVAGVTAGAKFGGVAVDLGWAKNDEGALGKQDDEDLYFVTVSASPMENVKIGGEVFLVHDMEDTTYFYPNLKAAANTPLTKTPDNAQSTVAVRTSDTVWTLDVNGAANFGMISVDGFLAYQFGTIGEDGDVLLFNPAANNGAGGFQSAGLEEDHSAFAGSVAVNAKLSSVNLGARLIYFSADDDANDNNDWIGGYGAFEYATENLHIFLPSVYNTGGPTDRIAITEAAYKGYGLMGFLAKADASFGNMFVKAGAGYFMALEDTTDKNAATKVHGKSLGFEVAAEVGAKILDGAAVVSLRGAYALVGDFFDVSNNVGGWSSQDDMYVSCLMLNIPY